MNLCFCIYIYEFFDYNRTGFESFLFFTNKYSLKLSDFANEVFSVWKIGQVLALNSQNQTLVQNFLFINENVVKLLCIKPVYSLFVFLYYFFRFHIYIFRHLFNFLLLQKPLIQSRFFTFSLFLLLQNKFFRSNAYIVYYLDELQLEFVNNNLVPYEKLLWERFYQLYLDELKFKGA